jgi:hypothetical protein
LLIPDPGAGDSVVTRFEKWILSTSILKDALKRIVSKFSAFLLLLPRRRRGGNHRASVIPIRTRVLKKRKNTGANQATGSKFWCSQFAHRNAHRSSFSAATRFQPVDARHRFCRTTVTLLNYWIDDLRRLKHVVDRASSFLHVSFLHVAEMRPYLTKEFLPLFGIWPPPDKWFTLPVDQLGLVSAFCSSMTNSCSIWCGGSASRCFID